MRPEFLENNFDILEEVVRVAKEKDVTPAQVSLAWLMHKDVVPIVGATTVQQIEEDIGAMNVHLTEDEIRRLEAPYKPHPILPDNMILANRVKEEQARKAFAAEHGKLLRNKR
jgi:aryl-alcohol dehydrogenase-like predicted oxidoreductase